MKKAILVLGPPRSGTSAVSHVIHKLGVHFGSHDRFVDSKVHAFNPIFFELQSLNNLNDEIFSHFSRSFANFDWLPKESDFDEEVILKFEQKIAEFVKGEFSTNNTIGLKDPRFCFTLPIWDTVLRRLGFDVRYVLTMRLSHSVFVSNKIVNNYSSATNFRIVAQSALLARQFVEGKKHVMVHYEDLLEDPRSIILRLCDELGLDNALIDAACAVIHGDLNHQEGIVDSCLYNYFESVIDSESVSPDELLRYREIFLAATFEKDQRIVSLNQAMYDKDVHINNISEILAERDSQIIGLNQRLAERDAAVAERDGQITSLNQGLAERDAAVAERDGVINQILSSRSWRVTRPLRLVIPFFTRKDGLLNVQENPQKRFDAAWYLARNPDVAMNGMDPYEHYMSYGKAEGRQPAPD